MGGVFGRVLRSRAYVPIMVVLLCFLFTLSSVEMLLRFGDWPPAFLASPPPIVIQQTVVQTPTLTPQRDVLVLGAVKQPGVYEVPANGFVRDAVAMAGGLLSDADLSRINLATALSGQPDVYVPHVGEVLPAITAGRLNLNHANISDLHDAVGVSLATARKIVAYRNRHGAFTSVNQLLLVPISRTLYDRISLLVTV